MKWIITSLVLLVLTGCKSTSGLDVVDRFEVDRYLGQWYEIARYPHRFEKGMSRVSATYSMNENGTIKVLNRGFVDQKEKWKQAEGVAKFKGDKNRGWLKVSFFKPFYASYKIIYLDPDYTKAIVTGPSYKYLWILAREPRLPSNELEDLIHKTEQFGFKRDRLIIVSHEANK